MRTVLAQKTVKQNGDTHRHSKQLTINMQADRLRDNHHHIFL